MEKLHILASLLHCLTHLRVLDGDERDHTIPNSALGTCLQAGHHLCSSVVVVGKVLWCWFTWWRVVRRVT